MKKLIFGLIIVCFLPLMALEISESGRIEKPVIEAEYYFQGGEYYADFAGKKFIGTSLHQTANGYISLTTLEETAPVWLRIYSRDGVLQKQLQFAKVINLKAGKNLRFAAFYDGKGITRIDSESNEIIHQNGTSCFNLNQKGEIVFAENSTRLILPERELELNEITRKIEFHKNSLFVSTAAGLWQVDELSRKIKTGNCFDLARLDGELYCSFRKIIKGKNSVEIFLIGQDGRLILQKKIESESQSRTHEDISSPLQYSAENYAHPIGNSYGEIQQYGETAYLHPGVDFLGADFQEVFAVHSGYVKAILTTGGEPYWRIAIANEDSSQETEGYLYAHLNESSFTVAVGDYVEAGQQIGTLYPWGYYDFTHIHYARIKASGLTWLGDWWTVDNPLVDTVNLSDDSEPVFENVMGNEKFAFRNEAGNYMDSEELSGSFDIIVSCYDLTNSDWKIDVWELDLELTKAEQPDDIIYTNFAFAYDFPLDTYGESNWDAMILNTIYSRDTQLFSVGNYDERNYFQIVSNSDGDDILDETDAANLFDSSQYNDGDYIIKVTARDANENESSTSLQVTFTNGVAVEDNETNQKRAYTFPNPVNFSKESSVQIHYSPKFEADTLVEIYNLRGQKICDLSADNSTDFVSWDGKDNNKNTVAEGIYFYKIIDSQSNICGKITILK